MPTLPNPPKLGRCDHRDGPETWLCGHCTALVGKDMEPGAAQLLGGAPVGTLPRPGRRFVVHLVYHRQHAVTVYRRSSPERCTVTPESGWRDRHPRSRASPASRARSA
jgi:hypothetical protein